MAYFYDEITDTLDATAFVKHVQKKYVNDKRCYWLNAWFYIKRADQSPQYKVVNFAGFQSTQDSVTKRGSRVGGKTTKAEVLLGYAKYFDIPGLNDRVNAVDMAMKKAGQNQRTAANFRFGKTQFETTPGLTVDQCWGVLTYHIDSFVTQFLQTEYVAFKTVISLGLIKIRQHQRMKLMGKGLKGGHKEGQFILEMATADKTPLLLISSDSSKDVTGDIMEEAKPFLRFTAGSQIKGVFHRPKSTRWIFTIAKINQDTPRALNRLYPGLGGNAAVAQAITEAFNAMDIRGKEIQVTGVL